MFPLQTNPHVLGNISKGFANGCEKYLAVPLPTICIESSLEMWAPPGLVPALLETCSGRCELFT